MNLSPSDSNRFTLAGICGEPSRSCDRDYSPVVTCLLHSYQLYNYTPLSPTGGSMGDHLTESDHERIAEFLATPSYDRRPELLVPDDAATGEESGVE